MSRCVALQVSFFIIININKLFYCVIFFIYPIQSVAPAGQFL